MQNAIRDTHAQKAHWVRVTPSLIAKCVPTKYRQVCQPPQTKILDERRMVMRVFEKLPFRSVRASVDYFFLLHAVNRSEFGKFIELRRATENEALPVNYDPVSNTHSL